MHTDSVVLRLYMNLMICHFEAIYETGDSRRALSCLLSIYPIALTPGLMLRTLVVPRPAVFMIGTLIVLSGCELVDQEPPELSTVGPRIYELQERLTQDADMLAGTWRWESSTGYFTATGEPHVRTPKSEGYTETLVFRSNDTLETRRDGVLQKTESYEVQTVEYPNGTSSDYPHLIVDGQNIPFAVGADTLVISSVAVDGPESIYTRVE